MHTRIGFFAAAAVVTQLGSGCSLAFVNRDFTSIAADASAATPNVAGTYEWIADIQGANPGTLSGTITFEQNGTSVTVTDTTHGNPADRDLMGDGELEGNTLTMRMVLRNGETDYSADVTFRAGNAVILREGFSVLEGAKLRVEVTTP